MADCGPAVRLVVSTVTLIVLGRVSGWIVCDGVSSVTQFAFAVSAFQLSARVPELLTVTVLVSWVPLSSVPKSSELGVTLIFATSFGLGGTTSSFTFTRESPPLTVAREIEPVYFPRARADDVTFTLNVVLPLVMVVAEGVTASQPLPDANVTVGMMVTPPVQAPVIPIVKLCDDGLGFDPI